MGHPPRASKTVLGSVARAAAGPDVSGDDRLTPVRAIDDRVTGRIAIIRSGPVPVVVLARGSALANRLRVLCNAERASIEETADPGTLERAAGDGPLVVVVDAVEAPDATPDAVVAALAHAPPHAQIVVWGEARAYGKELSLLAELAGHGVVALYEEHGVGPMVDLILSRRA